MTVRLVATVIACCILPSSVLGVDYPFNIFLSPKQFPCQGCDVQLIYRYAYNNTLGPQRENQIIWTFGGISVLIVRRLGTDLVIESSTNPRIQWAGPNDPGTITITDVHASDSGDYQCQVFFFSGDNVKGTVNVDATNLLAICIITPPSSQCGDSFAPDAINATPPTYSAGCNPQINWLDNSTGSMQNLNTTVQNATVTTGSCSGRSCSSLSVPSCYSASTVAYQAQWKVGSQVDITPQPLCSVTQKLCPTTTVAPNNQSTSGNFSSTVAPQNATATANNQTTAQFNVFTATLPPTSVAIVAGNATTAPLFALSTVVNVSAASTAQTSAVQFSVTSNIPSTKLLSTQDFSTQSATSTVPVSVAATSKSITSTMTTNRATSASSARTFNFSLDATIGSFTWIAALANSQSAEAIEYESKLCNEMARIFSTNSARKFAFNLCRVLLFRYFRQGSVYATFLLTDIESESVAMTTAQDLGDFMIQALANNNPLNIDTRTLTINSYSLGTNNSCSSRPCQQVCITSTSSTSFRCGCYTGYTLINTTTCIVLPSQSGSAMFILVLSGVLAGSLCFAIIICLIMQICTFG